MTASTRAPWSDFRSGLLMPLRSMRLILGQGNLLRLALLPMALTLLVTLLSLWAGYHWGQSWLAHFWAQPQACHDCSWYQWLWSRVSVSGWYLAWVGGTFALSAVGGLLSSRVLTALLMDSLALRFLETIGHSITPTDPVYGNHSAWAQVGRALKRGAVLLAGYALLGLVSLIPGAAVVTTPVGLIWTVLWLHVDNCCYALQWMGPARVADVRALSLSNGWLTAGFLTSSCGLQLVPFVGFAATPVTVGAACLYVTHARETKAVFRATVSLNPAA